MSVSFSCRCEERQKPVQSRAWYVLMRNVLMRNEHRSAFAGYRSTYSDYSLVYCFKCLAIGRTKAKYVEQLVGCTHEDWGRALANQPA